MVSGIELHINFKISKIDANRNLNKQSEYSTEQWNNNNNNNNI